jgi:hypothetical protein
MVVRSGMLAMMAINAAIVNVPMTAIVAAVQISRTSQTPLANTTPFPRLVAIGA